MNRWPLVVLVGLAAGGGVACGSTFDETCTELQSCGDDGGTGAETGTDSGVTPHPDGGADASADHTVPGTDASDGGGGNETGDDDGSTEAASDTGADAGCGDADTVDHCGQCGIVCAPPAGGNGTATCTPQGCGFACNTGFILCNDTCHDVTQPPSADECVIDDSLAVFVAPTGSDSNPGTKSLPFKTIGAAIVAARKTTSHRVIACAATYQEQVAFEAADDVGIQLYGGVSCPTGDAGPGWAYTGDKAVVAPTAHGRALSVSSLSKALTIVDFEFDAQNGSAPGESSIAAVIDSSPNVTLRNVIVKAGTGAKGVDGTLVPVIYPVALKLKGGAGSGNTGGSPCSISCDALGSTAGGTGGAGGGAGGNGTAGSSDPAVTSNGAGQSATQCHDGSGGPFPGGDAPAAADGPGASISGAWGASGWQPKGGTAGNPGGPGQGGGGGGGSATGAGGGGACGGCGGAGGASGSGGGASIALVISSSVATITLDSCTIAATTAGGGGAGTLGQPGQNPGGIGGLPESTGAGCLGGRGGNGGNGGAGGGGAGGVSVGLYFHGTAPTMTKTTPTAAASKAPAGVGGKPGSNDGELGVSSGQLSF
jgi:hypothetical protein